MTVSYVVLPGIYGSAPEHWQSRWEGLLSPVSRVRPSSWDEPVLTDWLRALSEAHDARPQGSRSVLVAHSLGCLTVAHWLAAGRTGVAAAFLVAPPDPDAPSFPTAAPTFRPVPLGPLGVPAVLVASRDDPYDPSGRADELAKGWGAHLVDVGARGHLNAGSGLGDWPEGRSWLAALCGSSDEGMGR